MRAFSLILFLFLTHLIFAQKFGYVNTEFIVKKMPEYKQALSELDALSKKWESEISGMKSEIRKMEDEYKAEEVLLTEEMKRERKAEIEAKRQEMLDFQQKHFGYEGLLFLKRQELIKPVREKVYDAIEKVSKKNNIAIMFDKSSDISMVYTNPRHDYTDYVLEELGFGDDKDQLQK